MKIWGIARTKTDEVSREDRLVFSNLFSNRKRMIEKIHWNI